jgi:hypothetical protein
MYNRSPGSPWANTMCPRGKSAGCSWLVNADTALGSTPAANFAGFAVNGIGPDPDWRQDACTNGAADGTRCGGIASIPGPGPRSGMHGALFQSGDDGSPVTSNDLLIGVAFGGNSAPANRAIPQIDFTQYTKFSAILADVNAKGGPGAGFTPIPA